MPAHPADRLLDRVALLRAPVCVGIDPVFEKLPAALADGSSEPAEAIGAFSVNVCRTVAEHVPCVKFQAACFERYGSRGVVALESAMRAAIAVGLVVILDSKRGDIGISAEHYAAAAFDASTSDMSRADWTTVSPYLGRDSLDPFLQRGGAFALVRTSNPSGDTIQRARLDNGRSVAEFVAELIAEIGSEFVGEQGYSALGAVVGATKRKEVVSLRRAMPQQVFLVPGFGAQGASVDDVLGCFHEDGRGAIITASRSIIYAFKQDDPRWTDAVADAASEMAEQIGSVAGLR